VVGVNVHQTVQVDEELEIRAYYAGHVLGAAMFYVRVGDQSVVYTGDYNMTPDRHLGAAWIEKLRPDVRPMRAHLDTFWMAGDSALIHSCTTDQVLITESTYATTIRDSKRWRERDFLKRVHSCVEKGGKVCSPPQTTCCAIVGLEHFDDR
jgi:integrator complex subunit 11